MERRRATAILLALLLALLLIAPAQAHANIVRSEPAAGAVMQTAPKEIVLEFSEDLDPSFSRVQLLDSKSQTVDPGPGTIDPAQPRVLRLALKELPKDSYTAVWRSRSAVDGHVSEGGVPFGVGVAVTTTSLIPPLGTPDPATETPPPLDSVARWLTLLAAAVAFGGLPFALLVWRPTYAAASRAGNHADTADQAMTRMLRRLIVTGVVLFLIANALFLIAQAATAAGVPVAQAIGAPVVQLLGGRSGILWLIRIGLALVVAALAGRLPLAGRGPAWPWAVATALGGVVLLTFSLNAHGAAVEQGAPVAIALDWLHIAAMVVWFGGLVPMALAIGAARRSPEQALPLGQLVPPFSRTAMICVAVLTATGIYSYILHINGLDLLAATTYGRALAIKLVLFGLLLLLGGLNQFIIAPRLRASGNRLARAFSRSVRAELVTGALLLAAVGAMTSVAPSVTAWEEHQRLGLAQTATVDNVDLALRVAPAQIGDNEFAVDVTDRRPGAQAAASKVLLRFQMAGMTMGALQAETQTSDTQRYTTRGSFMSMGGRWNVEVVLRRAGFDDVRHTFQLDVVREAAAAP